MEATGMALVLAFLIAMLLCVIALMLINCMLGMCHTLCKPWMGRHCSCGSSTSGSSSGAGTTVNGSHNFSTVKVCSGKARQQHEIMTKGASILHTLWEIVMLENGNGHSIRVFGHNFTTCNIVNVYKLYTRNMSYVL